MKKIPLLLASLLVLFSQVKAQNFTATLTGSPVVTTGWNVGPVTSVSTNTVVLTQPVTNQAGYIYYNTPTNLTNCSQWTATFEFQVTNSSAPPADGLTFFYITNPPAAFVAGGGMGMPTNPNGLILIFDTYDNNSTPANNPLVSLRNFNGTGNYVEEGPFGFLTPDLFGQTWETDGNWHQVILTYNNGVITVALNGNPPSITVTQPLTITNGYFGFTSGTGALYSKHSIRNVSIVGTFPPPPPTIASSTITYCQGDIATQLTATGTGALNWYTTPTGGTASSIAPTPSTSIPGTTIYYVSQAGANSCESPRAPITVVVNAKPGPPTGTLAYNYCLNDVVVPFNILGQNIKWYTAPTGGTGTTTAPTINTSTASSNTWYISQTVAGCESNRVPVTVNTGIKPAPPTVTTPVLYCSGATATPLTAYGQNLLWYNSPTGGVGASAPPVPNTGVQDTVTYWVTQSSNNCESIRSKMDVYVYYQPNGIILASSENICQGALDTFYYFGNAGLTDEVYNWHSPFLYTTALSGGGQGPFIVRFDSAGTFNIRLQVSHKICTSPEILMPVIVRPLPIVTTTLKDDGCVGEVISVGLDEASPLINGFTWNFGGADVITGIYPGGPFKLKWNTTGLHTVSVVASAAACPAQTVKDSIQIHALPDAGIEPPASKNICSGDTLSLDAKFQAEGFTYHWTPEVFFVNNDFWNVKATIKSGEFISLTVTDTFGCANTDSINFNAEPCCDIALPDAFSPNDDGKNDIFKIITKGHHGITAFRIVNRWGQNIFESDNELRGWDGKVNGVPQDMGVYYYYVKYKCDNGKFYEKKGELTLIR